MTFKNAEKEIRRCKENLSALMSNSHRNINLGGGQVSSQAD